MCGYAEALKYINIYTSGEIQERRIGKIPRECKKRPAKCDIMKIKRRMFWEERCANSHMLNLNLTII